MYDNYPEHDVPQQNIIQMFFAQRWSAIIIEMALAIVISVAAGRAFDFFGPIDAQTDNPPQEQSINDISLDAIQTYGIDDIQQGQSAEAEAMDNLAGIAFSLNLPTPLSVIQMPVGLWPFVDYNDALVGKTGFDKVGFGKRIISGTSSFGLLVSWIGSE